MGYAIRNAEGEWEITDGPAPRETKEQEPVEGGETADKPRRARKRKAKQEGREVVPGE